MSVTGQKTYGNKGTDAGFQVPMTEMTKKLLQRLTSPGGSRLITQSTPVTNEKFYAFVVQEDTVISSITGGFPPETTKDYGPVLGITGKILRQCALFEVPDGEFISNLSLTSGSVIGYRIH